MESRRGQNSHQKLQTRAMLQELIAQPFHLRFGLMHRAVGDKKNSVARLMRSKDFESLRQCLRNGKTRADTCRARDHIIHTYAELVRIGNKTGSE
jgi:hypothetical protein